MAGIFALGVLAVLYTDFELAAGIKEWSAEKPIIFDLIDAGDAKRLSEYLRAPKPVAVSMRMTKRTKWAKVEKALSTVSNGADINEVRFDGCLPLHYAAEWAGGDIVSVLLLHGADPKQLDDYDRTALQAAMAFRNTEAEDLIRAQARNERSTWDFVGTAPEWVYQ